VWDKHSLTLYYLEADGARLHLVAASPRDDSVLAVVNRKTVLTDVRLEDVENHPNYDVDPTGAKFVMPEHIPTGGLAVIFDHALSLRPGSSHTSWHVPSAFLHQDRDAARALHLDELCLRIGRI